MDTEYDKSVLKAMISTSASRKVYELRIKPENAVGLLNKVVMHPLNANEPLKRQGIF